MMPVGYKTISLSDKAYEKLTSLKKEGESFSDVVLKLHSKTMKRTLVSFAGTWDMTDEEVEQLFRETRKLWRRYENLLGHGLSSRASEKQS